MKNKIQARIEDLKSEYVKGQERLAQLEESARQLRGTLLRISGAIQALQEMESQNLDTPDN